jgi:hypothetical protein
VALGPRPRVHRSRDRNTGTGAAPPGSCTAGRASVSKLRAISRRLAALTTTPPAGAAPCRSGRRPSAGGCRPRARPPRRRRPQRGPRP